VSSGFSFGNIFFACWLVKWVPSSSVCLLARNSGGCRKPSVVWFHDARTGRCARFLYNGCGGNQNRFRTRERCEEMGRCHM
uniref:BPTI/Kunitz inhibitor domain-containing protein n=1 Tax=Poecilia reticulata TaxID=8081 RepID=A0A3P9PG91_POERE